MDRVSAKRLLNKETMNDNQPDTAEPADDIFGEKLYQKRARMALPILVRQAHAGEDMSYSGLAEELDMPNPRNLNFVLGSIGVTLLNLGEEWNSPIPAIQNLVINKATGIPSAGMGWLVSKEELKNYSLTQKRDLAKLRLNDVYLYSRWPEVLDALNLKQIAVLAPLTPSNTVGGGEGEEHQKLKLMVAENPVLVGLPKSAKRGEIEFPLPSGDKVDVLFRHKGLLIAVEIKSKISDDADLYRGLFQCVKYKAVLEKQLAVNGEPQNVRAILYIDREFPKSLICVKNTLGTEVIRHHS